MDLNLNIRFPTKRCLLGLIFVFHFAIVSFSPSTKWQLSSSSDANTANLGVIFVAANENEDNKDENEDIKDVNEDKKDDTEDKKDIVDEDKDENEQQKNENEDATVVDLTDATFDYFLKKYDKVLVAFHAPWCGHCKSLLPELRAAGEIVRDRGLSSRICLLDSIKESEISNRYEISGYPTLKYFTGVRTSYAKDYTGGRTRDEIVTWLERRELPLVPSFEYEYEMNKWINDIPSDSECVGVIAKVIKNSTKHSFIKAYAKELIDVDWIKIAVLYVHQNNDVQIQITKAINPAFKLPDDKDLHTYKGEIKHGNNLWTKESLTYYIKLQEIRTVNQKLLLRVHLATHELKLLFVIYKGEDESEIQRIADALHNMHENANKYRFFLPREEVELLSSMGFEQKSDGICVVDVNTPNKDFKNVKKQDLQSPHKYYLEGPFDVENVRQFMKSIDEGTQERFIKSEPVPEANNDLIKTVVGTTLDEIVLNPQRNVFVMYYKDGCPHCDEAKVQWKETATAVSKRKSMKDTVDLAMMHVEKNDLQQPMSGVPTFVFYPAVKDSWKNRREFDDSRTVDSFLDFIEEVIEETATAQRSEEL